MLCSSRLYFIVLLLAICSCKSKINKRTNAYTSYNFDTSVIQKLPLYNSLVFAISNKIHLFQNNIDLNDAYQAFRYMPASDEPEVFKKLPDEIDINIDKHFAELGEDFIYGFDVFKDSSIKIYIRRKEVDSLAATIEENLSYYPEGNSKKSRDYPVKDTVLNINWQYWIRFDIPSFF